MTASFYLAGKHNLAVETFIGDGANNRLQSSLTSASSNQVHHQIKVYWQRGFPAEIQVEGYLASDGGVGLTYVVSSNGQDRWSGTKYSVVKDADFSCQMANVGSTRYPARVQCTRVVYNNPWWYIFKRYTSVLGNVHVEYQFTVK